jgi:hypothetical protein
VNGKIGLCYVGDNLTERAQWRGYSPWNLAEFKKDTGIDVPLSPREGFSFLRKSETAWEAWLSWRCRRTAALYRDARDCLRSIRPDFTLLLACDLPSEVPGMNVEWGRGVPVRDLLRYHGYDPALLVGLEGIWSSRAHMVNSDRFFGKWGPPHSTHAWAHKAFQYDQRLAECFVPRAFRTVELYHNYWEESPHPENEFGPHLRTANGAPLGPHFLEPVPYVLRVENAARLLFMGWQRASINGEVLFRRLARQWRSLPLGPIKPFHGWIECERGGWRGTCHGGSVWARYHGTRLVVANETVEEVDAVLN